MSRYFLVQDPYHEYAVQFIEHIHRKYGYRAICFYSDRQLYLRQAPAFPLLRSRYVAATYEVMPNELARFAVHLRSHYDIAAVVPFNEPTVLAAAELAERLQLSWSQPEVLRRFRNKHALKEHLRGQDAGLRINAVRQIHSLDEVMNTRTDGAYERFILKPNDGFGNRRIGLFDKQSSATQIEQYLQGASGPVLMEEYIDGTEYFVNGQIDGQGEITIVAIFEYQRIAANDRYNIDFETRRLAQADPLFATLASYAQQVMRASGLLRSPFHLELKVDARGPCLIEVGARLPGLGNAFISGKLHGSSLALFEVAAHYYLDHSDYGTLPLDWQTYDATAVRYVHGIATRHELVYSLHGVNAIEALSGFDSWVKKPSVGDRLIPTIDCLSMPWSVVINAPNELLASETAAQVRSLLQWNQPPSYLHRLSVQAVSRLKRYRLAIKIRLLSLQLAVGREITVLTKPNVAIAWWLSLCKIFARINHAIVRRLQLASFGKRKIHSAAISIAPEHQALAQQAVCWAEEYLARPHPQLGRKGPICPFVKHTVDIGGYAVSVHGEIDGGSINKLRRVVLDEAAAFLQRSPNVGSKGAFASLVILFPHIPQHRLAILDQLHSELKTPLMERDLMFSPFHQNSTKPSLLNPEFKVFRAPFAALVVRHMDVRDIAFLNTNRDAFMHFRSRYAPMFAQGKVSNEFGYVRMYEEACARFGS
jgi:ATP-grasp domain